MWTSLLLLYFRQNIILFSGPSPAGFKKLRWSTNRSEGRHSSPAPAVVCMYSTRWTSSLALGERLSPSPTWRSTYTGALTGWSIPCSVGTRNYLPNEPAWDWRIRFGSDKGSIETTLVTGTGRKAWASKMPIMTPHTSQYPAIHRSWPGPFTIILLRM